MGWEGECKKCGDCCKNGINWLFFDDEETKYNSIHWAQCRGYKIIQIGKNYIQAEYKSVCPNLNKKNECDMHLINKPNWCKNFPYTMEGADGLDISLMVPLNCGYMWVGKK